MVQVALQNYLPSELLYSEEHHTALASQFQREVLSDENNFKDFVRSYGLADIFLDATGQVKLKHLPEDTATFLYFLQKKIGRENVLTLSFNPQAMARGTLRTVNSYTKHLTPPHTHDSLNYVRTFLQPS